jgi:hypothetical protein
LPEGWNLEENNLNLGNRRKNATGKWSLKNERNRMTNGKWNLNNETLAEPEEETEITICRL